ncbi:putative Diguanylate cyclase [Candidatus Nitrotoga sp. BS]|uniref:EAL domain-containing protein n=1 Tax=Candidatus Nitrotoga sp. BS TaxID=2890408 RepID=UPI001EF2E7A9|nr:EAL domain-containing protein [Candidatus Nitrotoga sp. BS]CAH1198324.1 putative Diguanylate cyclase [Candidatus Nitrotoga sp. BS]
MSSLAAKLVHPLWIPLTALVLAWALSFTSLYQHLDVLSLDKQTRLAAQQHFFQDALVIDIDDASLRAMQPYFGPWPYKRDTFALLLDYLGEMGARAVVFDITFADQRENDGRLREAIARNPNVVLAATMRIETESDEHAPTDLHGLTWDVPSGLPSYSWSAIQLPLASFTQPAPGYADIGVVTVQADRDGVLRRFPLFHRIDGQVIPSLPLAAHFSGVPHPPVRAIPGNSIQVDPFNWSTDNESAVHLFYPSNPNSVLSIPFSRIAMAVLGSPNQELSPAMIRGKTVFIGSTAIFADRVHTPVGEISGLYLLAITHQLLAQNLVLTPPRWYWTAGLLLIAVVPALLLIWQPRRSLLTGTAIGIGAALIVYVIHLSLLHWLKQESSLLLPLLVVLFVNMLEAMRSHRLLNKEQKAKIHVLANVDPLTQLPNRCALHALIAHAIEGAHMNKSSLAILLVDLDDFNTINDTLGLETGDQMLLDVTARLKLSVRTNDIVARLGGDEFGIVVHGVETASAVLCAEKILSALAQPYHLTGQALHITSSIGISLYPDDGSDAASLLKNAGAAMYHAKAQARNSYCQFTSDLSRDAMDRLLLENQLHQALARNEFVLFYQPQINVRSGRMIAVEALVRWNHPVHGLLFPDSFIPMAEKSGLILPLGEWVLRTACRQMQVWHAAGLTHINRVAINLSARQFEQPTLPAVVASVLKETQLDAAHLELEITESAAMKNPQHSIEILNTLRSMGITLSLDDFGTGHSSLTYLKLFPITSLKIDKSFVRDIETDHLDAEICASTIALAHKLGLNVVAEGVENAGQLLFLRNIKCGDAQGYFFSHPLSATDLESFKLVQ